MNTNMKSIQMNIPMDEFIKKFDDIIRDHVDSSLPDLVKDNINDQYNIEDIIESMVSMEINNMDIQNSIIESVDYKKLAHALIAAIKENN